MLVKYWFIELCHCYCIRHNTEKEELGKICIRCLNNAGVLEIRLSDLKHNSASVRSLHVNMPTIGGTKDQYVKIKRNR